MKDQWPKEDVHYPENRKQSSIGFLTEVGVPVTGEKEEKLGGLQTAPRISFGPVPSG